MLEPIQENSSLQFLDLSGNIINNKSALITPEEMQEYYDEFNNIINGFIESSKNCLIYLNLSKMIDTIGTKIDLSGKAPETKIPLDVPRLLTSIGNFNQVLQCIKLDNNFIP